MAQVQGSGTSQVKQLFSYDANGDVISVNYNGTEYFYLRNGQNDVVGLMDANGNRVVEYTYDAWGKLISTSGTLATSLGADNPFRYRGYYYDTETGLYYLMTRYYAPEVCRFISADVYMTTGQGVLGGNMWAYCLNNPANMTDSNGEIAIVDDAAVLLLLLLLGVVVVTAYAVVDVAVSSIGSVGGILSEPLSPIEKTYIETFAAVAAVITVLTTPRTGSKISVISDDEPKSKTPDIDYPGDDSSQPPDDDYEWKGKPPKGGDKGSWVNKKTGEQLHPDLKHSLPKGPHWDYKDPFKNWWRIFPNNRIEPK